MKNTIELLLQELGLPNGVLEVEMIHDAVWFNISDDDLEELCLNTTI